MQKETHREGREGNRNVIGGQGVVIKTWGSVIDQMIVKDKSVMIVGLGSGVKRENQMGPQRIRTGGIRERKPKIIQMTRRGISHLAHFSH